MMISIFVGASKFHFHVHKDLLMQESPYFRGALNGAFIEATTGVVELEDADAELFTVFIAWLYSRKLVTYLEETGCSNEKLANLYLFADRFNVPNLRNALIDEYTRRQAKGELISVNCFRIIHEGTAANDPMRCLLVDFLAWDKAWGRTVVAENPTMMPMQILAEVMAVMWKIPSEDTEWAPFRVTRCLSYHKHEDVTVCYDQGPVLGPGYLL
ncbi:hypothetical protein MMC18_001054 [Xylographa bjoerkii]|nr:hypothetical protein [Xylographa bjoerkii]